MSQRSVDPFAPPVADLDGGVVEPLVADTPLASRMRRVAAFLIDIFLFLVSGVPGALIARLAGISRTSSFGYVLTSISFLLFFAYQCYLIATSGQTLGKRWLGIRIVKLNGLPVSFVSGVLLRLIVPVLFACVPKLGLFVLIFDPVLI